MCIQGRRRSDSPTTKCSRQQTQACACSRKVLKNGTALTPVSSGSKVGVSRPVGVLGVLAAGAASAVTAAASAAPSNSAGRTQQAAMETFSSPAADGTRARPFESTLPELLSSIMMRLTRARFAKPGWVRKKGVERCGLRWTGAS